MSHTITTSVDADGRVTLPEEARARIGLRPGAAVLITFDDDHLEMTPMPSRVRIVRKGRLSVAVSDDDLGPLTEDQVLAVRDELRSRAEM